MSFDLLLFRQYYDVITVRLCVQDPYAQAAAIPKPYVKGATTRMETTFFEMTEQEKALVLEVMKNARKQEYTPEKLCEIQKIIDTQYFYWWMNDLKKEELANEIFEDELECYCTGAGFYKSSAHDWAVGAKYCNSFINSAHMGHQPLVWLQDDTHAKGIFFFESNMNYLDNKDLHEHFFIYCHDFVKRSNGRWAISAYRLIQTKLHGVVRPETFVAPADYIFPPWEEV